MKPEKKKKQNKPNNSTVYRTATANEAQVAADHDRKESGNENENDVCPNEELVQKAKEVDLADPVVLLTRNQ